MVKRNQSKQSNAALSEGTSGIPKKNKSMNRRGRSGAKPKRAGKQRAHAKRTSNKKTRGKRTKRTGGKRGGRKGGAHHAEESQNQVHEAVANSE
jgi:hypothetical protein